MGNIIAVSYTHLGLTWEVRNSLGKVFLDYYFAYTILYPKNF